MNSDFNLLASPSFNEPPEMQTLVSPEGDLHLRFYVPSGNEFALAASGIREVISASPERITCIPNTSPLLLGTLNWRGQVIWVADLGEFLGEIMPFNTNRPEIPIIVIEDQETIIGLAVDQIVGMDWLSPELIRQPRNVPDSMAPLLKGEWVLNPEKNHFLRLLDQLAIVRSARWAT
ncbi:chemotaxis protein CheW [Merismopedia glauca]|uniref:Chemotaxis protein CheW n=1 Tax=Merismopedia glauca CCAP 1448/3 TaxID=1296344 RepID=A0A2T1C5K7_9CYAN|nr:chemotaxis protein CheW [Merismopedia glauca]PSB03565.1 chemotaxis protein CheW [Merismopedia glauca CCAP 1448/3]